MPNCPRCGFKKWLKTDRVNKQGIRKWACGRCGTIHDGDTPMIRQAPRILYLDIETSLSQYYNFGQKVRGEYLNIDNLIHEYYIICWSASWVGSNYVHSGVVSPKDALKWTDKNILGDLCRLMDCADIIAGHNIDRFDLPRINTRFMLNGISKPEDYQTRDTLRIARSKFAFESNKLDYISQRLGFRAKDDMSGEDWRAIAERGDEKTLKKMVKYNRGDVRNGKAVFESMVKWTGTKMDFGMRRMSKEPKDLRYIEQL